MLIQYCSDIHLEFVQNRLYLEQNPIEPKGDILILAGDISYWGKKHFKHSFFDYVSNHFEAVYYLPGNHEFYSGKDLRIIDNEVYEAIRDNVFLVNNKVITIGDVGLFFSTLWSEIPISKSLIVESNVSDFHKIKYRGKNLNADIFNALHKVSLQFLNSAITSSKMNKKVIVSHHVPSLLCNPDQYKNSDISSAFVSEQFSLIEDWGADYWIYGHNHFNMGEQTIGKTKLVSNQLGYVQLGESIDYRESAYFEM